MAPIPPPPPARTPFHDVVHRSRKAQLMAPLVPAPRLTTFNVLHLDMGAQVDGATGARLFHAIAEIMTDPA